MQDLLRPETCILLLLLSFSMILLCLFVALPFSFSERSWPSLLIVVTHIAVVELRGNVCCIVHRRSKGPSFLALFVCVFPQQRQIMCIVEEIMRIIVLERSIRQLSILSACLPVDEDVQAFFIDTNQSSLHEWVKNCYIPIFRVPTP